MSFVPNLLATKMPFSKEKIFKPKEPKAKLEPMEPSSEPQLALKHVAGPKNPLLARNKEAAVTNLRNPRNALHPGIRRGYRL